MVNWKITKAAFISVIPALFLAGCASSDVSRDAEANVDLGVQNAKGFADNGQGISESYWNASQTQKGALLGGVAGVATGIAYTSVGWVPGGLAGAILGASYGAYIDAHTTLKDQLENRGVTVVTLGDQILVVLPSARVFYPMTPTIKPAAFSTLNLVGKYINQYTKMLVKVSAYTNCSHSNAYDLSLSQQQANNVVRYFTAIGLDARVLYATGYGGTRLVNRNNDRWDANDNYRIEITLEKLPV